MNEMVDLPGIGTWADWSLRRRLTLRSSNTSACAHACGMYCRFKDPTTQTLAAAVTRASISSTVAAALTYLQPGIKLLVDATHKGACTGQDQQRLDNNVRLTAYHFSSWCRWLYAYCSIVFPSTRSCCRNWMAFSIAVSGQPLMAWAAEQRADSAAAMSEKRAHLCDSSDRPYSYLGL